MFGWFRKRKSAASDGELARYTKAIEDNRDHPVVARWFHQITPCRLEIPGAGAADFLMIEFRDGPIGAMVWGDGQGQWGTGGWLPRTREGVLPIDVGYLQGAPAAGTFFEVLEMVAARRAEIGGAS